MREDVEGSGQMGSRQCHEYRGSLVANWKGVGHTHAW